jgi:myo-inositol-1(or 4)-monophosphatase
VRSTWSRAKKVSLKGPVDLVTETDREAEAFLTRMIHDEYPTHIIIAEEAAAGRTLSRPPADAATWYIDPLDGTVNFAHSVPHFAISVGFALGTQLQIGIVYDPMRDELFVGRRGGGAWLNDEPIRVSTVEDLGAALLATGLPYDRRERSAYYMAFASDFVAVSRDVRRFGSAALDLCYVACGRFDGYWEWGLHPWDLAAGSLILEEAGGRVSAFDGRPLDMFGGQTLASNSKLHGAMSSILRQRLG